MCDYDIKMKLQDNKSDMILEDNLNETSQIVSVMIMLHMEEIKLNYGTLKI